MRSRPILILLTFVGAACAAPPDKPSDATEMVAVGSAAEEAGATSAVQPAFVPVEADCDFVALHAHDDPEALVEEYLERDSRGEFLQSEEWLPQATTCPGHDPGPDTYTVIASYSSHVLEREENRLAVEVTSQRLGYRDYRGFDADAGVEIDTVRAVLTPYGWRIESPALRQYVIEN